MTQYFRKMITVKLYDLKSGFTLNLNHHCIKLLLKFIMTGA